MFVISVLALYGKVLMPVYGIKSNTFKTVWGFREKCLVMPLSRLYIYDASLLLYLLPVLKVLVVKMANIPGDFARFYSTSNLHALET